MKNVPLTSDEQLRVNTAATRERESALSRIVILFIGTGLAFMLLPGTFLGVWNLLSISNKHAADRQWQEFMYARDLGVLSGDPNHPR